MEASSSVIVTGAIALLTRVTVPMGHIPERYVDGIGQWSWRGNDRKG
jgi:hypothetical protein